MKFWKQPEVRRARYLVGVPAILLPALYFLPIPTVALILCGFLDIRRHQTITWELIENYFAGKGFLTWMLSPINLFGDLFSHKNKIIFRLEDFPPEHRSEIEACVRGFVENRDLIKAHIAKSLEHNKRAMWTFKWYNTPQITDLRIPAFERNYRYMKTIAVSVFNTRESTSRHFGPLRFTYRVLYNLDPIDSREVFIEVDGRVHYWVDNPLFIFDDTAFHRSVNGVDHVRYCLFMDIVRPNYAPAAFETAVKVVSAIAGWFKWMFYKNWSFIR